MIASSSTCCFFRLAIGTKALIFIMDLGTLHRKVAGSRLVKDVGTFKTLAGLLGVRCSSLELKMLFSTNVHGWSDVAAFHQNCDNVGPTLVLIRDCSGISYGGYTCVSWSSTSSYYQADRDPMRFCSAFRQTHNRAQSALRNFRRQQTHRQRCSHLRIGGPPLEVAMTCKPSRPKE